MDPMSPSSNAASFAALLFFSPRLGGPQPSAQYHAAGNAALQLGTLTEHANARARNNIQHSWEFLGFCPKTLETSTCFYI